MLGKKNPPGKSQKPKPYKSGAPEKKAAPVAKKPAPKPVPKPAPKPVDIQAVARQSCSKYWGPEGGEANDFSAFATGLRELKLDKGHLQRLRDWLPLNASGMTGDKVRNIDSLLARMESGA